jgi:hypothetical protein
MRLIVFLAGTVIMHAGAIGRTREERIAQARIGTDATLRDYSAYVPIGNAAAKLERWRAQGAEIDYLSSHRNPDEVAKEVLVLQKYAFPSGRVLARAADESYGDVVGQDPPDVLIEDDCESIGAAEITYPQIRVDLRARIKSIVVPEFGGIEHLPDSLPALLAF